jgi:hypothetical protein
MPGTDTKVMPEILAPTIPNATIYQGDLRLPRKNASLLDFLPVTKRLQRVKRRKYRRMVKRIVMYLNYKMKNEKL